MASNISGTLKRFGGEMVGRAASAVCAATVLVLTIATVAMKNDGEPLLESILIVPPPVLDYTSLNGPNYILKVECKERPAVLLRIRVFRHVRMGDVETAATVRPEEDKKKKLCLEMVILEQ
ncbi:hypothetical protein E5D57_013699 [Metarhizium anisopliae]|nr:hypothetical protein E5D57_013699 [Metarhizium anisopliae]